MATLPEARNPFYFLLLIVGLIFIATVLAYAVIPVLEQRAMDAGTMPPASPLRDALRNDGAIWILLEVSALVILGLLSMGMDRYRRCQQEASSATESSNAPAATKVENPPPT